MREYGITFDEGSGLAEGHYLLHRRDGLSLPTVFGSFDAGVCGPIEGTAATRLCMAMGHELSKVERFCMRSAEATVVWSADGKPSEPKTIDEEIATLGAEDQLSVGRVLDGKTDHRREELEDGSRWFREKGLPAIAVAFMTVAAKRPAAEERRIESVGSTVPPEFPAPSPGDLAHPSFEAIEGAPVDDDPALPRLDPDADPSAPMVSAESEVDDIEDAETDPEPTAGTENVLVAPGKARKKKRG